MNTDPPFVTPRPRRHRKREEIVRKRPRNPIAEVRVSAEISSQLIITFASPIEWDGASVPTNFLAWTSDEMMDPPIGVIRVGDTWIEVEFNGGVTGGAPWELNGPMVGITPETQWPEAGVVLWEP